MTFDPEEFGRKLERDYQDMVRRNEEAEARYERQNRMIDQANFLIRMHVELIIIPLIFSALNPNAWRQS